MSKSCSSIAAAGGALPAETKAWLEAAPSLALQGAVVWKKLKHRMKNNRCYTGKGGASPLAIGRSTCVQVSLRNASFPCRIVPGWCDTIGRNESEGWQCQGLSCNPIVHRTGGNDHPSRDLRSKACFCRLGCHSPDTHTIMPAVTSPVKLSCPCMENPGPSKGSSGASHGQGDANACKLVKSCMSFVCDRQPTIS